MNLRAAGLTSYEAEIIPKLNGGVIELAVVVLTWLLPPASGGCVLLALALQNLQMDEPVDTIKAGQMLAIGSLVLSLVGLAFARAANRQPSVRRAQRRRKMTQHRESRASEWSAWVHSADAQFGLAESAAPVRNRNRNWFRSG